MFFAINFQAFPDWLSFEAVLMWLLVGGGGVYVANYVFALIAENWTAWHNFPKVVKFILPVLVAIGLAFLAQFILAKPDLIGVVQPYWMLVISILLAYLGSQNAYMKAKASNYAQKTIAAAAEKKK